MNECTVVTYSYSLYVVVVVKFEIMVVEPFSLDCCVEILGQYIN
jgi:hypothetical protein